MASHTADRVTFDADATSEKASSKQCTPVSSRIGSIIETPRGPVVRRNTNASMAALAVIDQNDVPHHTRWKDRWPSGWRPWACELAGFMLMFSSWGYINAYGTYATQYKSELLPELSFIAVLMIGTTQEFMILLDSAIIGRLVDANHHAKVLGVGTLFCAIGMFGQTAVHASSGLSQQVTFFLLWLTQGFLCGLGMSCFFVTSSQVVATWFVETKSFAVGFVACGASAGGAIYSFAFKYLEVDIGITNASACVAAIMIGTCIVAIILGRPNPDTKHDNKIELKLSTFWDKDAMKNQSYVWFVAGFSIMFCAFYSVFFCLEEWATVARIGFRGTIRPDDLPTQAMATFELLAIMNGCSFVGRLTAAAVSDHLGRYGALHTHTLVTAVSAVLIGIVWIFVKDASAALGFVIVFGIFSGAVIALPAASVAYIIGKHNSDGQKKLGQWVGMMYTIAAVPAAIGPIVCGAIFQTTGSFLGVKIFCGVGFLVATICMFVSMYYKHKDWRTGSDESNEKGLQRSETSSLSRIERVA